MQGLGHFSPNIVIWGFFPPEYIKVILIFSKKIKKIASYLTITSVRVGIFEPVSKICIWICLHNIILFLNNHSP